MPPLYFFSCAEVRENTIASLKTAASYGADFVEFDVQLSKDLIPVIYHDFHVCISMKRKNDSNEMEMLELPVKELTLDQLHLLKVRTFYHCLYVVKQARKGVGGNGFCHHFFPLIKFYLASYFILLLLILLIGKLVSCLSNVFTVSSFGNTSY